MSVTPRLNLYLHFVTAAILLLLSFLGVKNPLECSIAEDYIYKAVVVLEYQTGKCRLKQAKEVARVILAAARGWDIRNRELLDAMEARGFFPPFVSLKHESKTLMDDFVDHMVIVSHFAF